MKPLLISLLLLSLGCIGNEIVPAQPIDTLSPAEAGDTTPHDGGIAQEQSPGDSAIDADGAPVDVSCMPADDPVDWAGLYQQAVSAGGTVHKVADEVAMQAALDLVEPGDVILVEDGDYSGWNVNFGRQGTEQKPILVTAESKIFGAGLGGGVTFRNSGSFAHFNKARWFIVGGFSFDNIYETVFYLRDTDTAEDANTDNRFTDNTIRACGHDRGGAVAVVEIRGRNHRNRFDHNIFEGNYGICIRLRWESDDRTLGPATETRIDHNEFRQAATSGYDPELSYGAIPFGTCCSTFREGDPDPTVLFEHNSIVHRRPVRQISNNSTSINVGGAVVRYNTIVSDGASLRIYGHRHQVYGNVLLGSGISLQGSNHRIMNNIIVGDDQIGRGISLPRWGRMTPPACNLLPDTHDVLIAHNTIIGPLEQGLWIGHCNNGACRPLHDNILIANNLISMGAGELINYNTKDEPGRTSVCDEATYGWQADGPNDADGGLNTGVTFRGNLYHAHGEASAGNAFDLDEAPISASSCVLEDLDPIAAPARLGAGCSAAIDAAQSISGHSEVGVDFEGQSRGCDAPDVGADELGCACP